MKFDTDGTYRVYINDNLYFEIAYDYIKKEPYISSQGNATEIAIEMKKMGNIFIFNVAGIPQVSIDLDKGTYLTRLNIIPTAAVRNYVEDLRNSLLDKDFESNRKYYDGSHIEKPRQVTTELHTHFMEVLNGEDFLNLILPYIEEVGFDKDGNQLTSFPTEKDNLRKLNLSAAEYWEDADRILNDDTLFQKMARDLCLPMDRQVDFSFITSTLSKRNALVALAIHNITEQEIKKLGRDVSQSEYETIISNAKTKIYEEMLMLCLEVLKKDGIKYVEFSYSNDKNIERMMEKLKGHRDGEIEFAFLLSAHRTKEGTKFCEFYHDNDGNIKKSKKPKKTVINMLRGLLDKGYVKGFDLMGAESEILSKDFIKDSTNASSWYDKLMPILKELNSRGDKTLICRLHAGEMVDAQNSTSNPQKTLELIEKIANTEGLIIPPPSIRIGHGLHITQNEEYLRLLKKFKVIVEINASSNFALKNIKNMKDIPYMWYARNNVPIVLDTDGGGFYLTNGKDEAYIAELFSGKTVLSNVEQTESRIVNPSFTKPASSYNPNYETPSINSSNFIELENIRPFEELGIVDQIRSEYIRMQAFYHDKLINEVYYNLNQLYVINNTLDIIREKIMIQDYENAKNYMIALQVLLGIEIKFEGRIFLEEYVDVEMYYGRQNPFSDDNGNIKRGKK